MDINLPTCSKHSNQKKNWVCLSKDCESRLFCSHCVIFDHNKVHKEYREIKSFLQDPMVSLFPGSKFAELTDNLSFEEKIYDLLNTEEKKLNQRLDEILCNLKNRFHEIRNEFHEIMIKFLNTCFYL